MSAPMIIDPVVISAPETQSAASILVAQSEVEFAVCDCCGLTEECTPAYIERIRERYHGKWVCGLCAEAVKDEIVRSERLVCTEEAMAKHMNFCKMFKASGPPPNPAVHLISAMRQILRRSLDSPRVRSTRIVQPRLSQKSMVLCLQGLRAASLPSLKDWDEGNAGCLVG